MTGVADAIPLPPELRDAILTWYDERGRRLPFRGTADPYAILVSEAMSQQTQAARAGEAWLRFMARFPTVVALAAAAPGDVLRQWRGLGYNRRALNLWRAARQIIEQHGGRVPADLGALQGLPGVGPYTARAIAAIAFGQPIGAVDTNVRRVLGRIVAGEVAALPAPGLQALADQAVPADRAADWTHAVMDIGATLCRPRRPDCDACPARVWCHFAVEQVTGDRSTTPRSHGPGLARRTVDRERRAPFATTSRWLRGQIVDRLRLADDGAWVVVVGPIGEHGQRSVAEALAALSREGLVELDPSHVSGSRRRARLPAS